MSKYDELRMAVSSLVTAEDAYWGKLHKAYHEFHSQLSNYLGLTNEAVRDGDGIAQPVLQVGLFYESEKQIQFKPGFLLPKDDRKLCFDVLLNLCSSESGDIQIANLIKVKVSRNGDEYYFESSITPSKVTCYEIDGRLVINPFFDELHASILKGLRVK